MSRNPFARLLSLSLALGLAACAAYQAQHQAAVPRTGAQEGGPAATLPSGEFSELQPDAQISRVKGEVEEVKANLSQQGRYSCCIDPPCNQCLLKYGECHCRDVIRQGGSSCGECNEGWVEGKGIVEGVDAADLLERARKKLEGGNRKESGEGKPPEPPHHHRH